MQIISSKDYKRRPDIVLFDLDGTITDMPPFLAWITPQIYELRKTLRSLFTTAAETETPVVTRHRPPFHLGFLRRLVRPGIKPGLVDALDYAEQNGIHTGIVSNGFAARWGWPLIQKFKIAATMDRYVFREHVQRKGGQIKPAPDGILLAMEKWKDEMGPGKTVWFVGDMDTDIDAALAADKRVDYTVIPVAIGEYSLAARRLQALKEDVPHGLIFKTYAEFTTHLKDLAARAAIPAIKPQPV